MHLDEHVGEKGLREYGSIENETGLAISNLGVRFFEHLRDLLYKVVLSRK